MNFDQALKVLLNESTEKALYMIFYVNEEEAARRKFNNEDVCDHLEFVILNKETTPEQRKQILNFQIVNKNRIYETGGKIIFKIVLNAKANVNELMHSIARKVAPEDDTLRDYMSGLIDQDYEFETEADMIKKGLSSETEQSFGGLIDAIV
jgi:hypothetical protein